MLPCPSYTPCRIPSSACAKTRLVPAGNVLQSVDPMASPGTGGPAARISLVPVLGLVFGIAVSVGGTLGVGILRQPGPVASYLRVPWLIMLMWLGGAVYSACGASNVSELATMIPRAGGFYVYAREAWGTMRDSPWAGPISWPT